MTMKTSISPAPAEEVCPAPFQRRWERRIAQAAQTVFETVGLSVYARADFIVTPDGTPISWRSTPCPA